MHTSSLSGGIRDGACLASRQHQAAFATPCILDLHGMPTSEQVCGSNRIHSGWVSTLLASMPQALHHSSLTYRMGHPGPVVLQKRTACDMADLWCWRLSSGATLL